MNDRRRQARLARGRPAPKLLAPPARSGLQHSAARRALRDVYDADHVAGGGGRFRWLLSTCLAAAVGAVAIAIAIMGSVDSNDTTINRMPTIDDFLTNVPAPQAVQQPADGLRWAIPKVDRLQTASETPTAKHIIHEQIQVKRDNRPFIQIRPYIRYVARLQPASSANGDVIPAFNPLRLYASDAAGDDAATTEGSSSEDVALQVVELLGSVPPGEDGQELSPQEALQLAARDLAGAIEGMRPSLPIDGAEGLLPRQLLDGPPMGGSEPLPPNTTVLTKTTIENDVDVSEDLEQSEVRVVRVGRGDTVVKILTRLGADAFQARLMVEAAKSIFQESQLAPGQEVRVTLVPTLQRQDRMEPAAFSVFGDGHDHKVSVTRNAAGEFVASTSPVDARIVRAAMADSDQAQSSSLYASVYSAALMQGLSTDAITRILRIHAYETDFRRRVRPSDSAEFFFETAEDQPAGAEPVPGELLYSALNVGGEQQRYWRFRTPDGIVDYYDEFGNNPRKFLMRRPIRGENVHFASGYGIRYHPLLNERRLHSGVDWAAPIGTPILASGNGTVEEADRKGQYGNYVRLRHANGYQTAYAHMSRFGPGIRQGVKVRQGQVIGFVGTTGLSSGPHLHFEVLVNNRFVDPMQIQVPRERRLTGKQAAAFQRERQRIDELMRRAPVMTVAK